MTFSGFHPIPLGMIRILGDVCLVIGLVAQAWSLVILNKARVRLQHSTELYNSASIVRVENLRVVASEMGLQMCGGCGIYLTQESIDACAGEDCPRYLRGKEEEKIMAH